MHIGAVELNGSFSEYLFEAPISIKNMNAVPQPKQKSLDTSIYSITEF